MITVNVLINGNTLVTRSARRVFCAMGPGGEFCSYMVDDGRNIIHNRADGPAVLAGKMLEGCINIDTLKPPLWAKFSAWLLSVKIW